MVSSTPDENIAIGMDLGVTHCCCAFYKDEKVEFIANEYGKTHTPAFVAFKSKDERLIGEAAYSKVTQLITSSVFGTKRLQGRKLDDEHVKEYLQQFPFQVEPGQGGKPRIVVTPKNQDPIKFSVIDITAMLIGQLKANAEKHLGQPVKNVVVTVPGNFSHL